jgi:hypothetical protein
MNDPKDLMEQIARLDDELDIQPKPLDDASLRELRREVYWIEREAEELYDAFLERKINNG